MEVLGGWCSWRRHGSSMPFPTYLALRMSSICLPLSYILLESTDDLWLRLPAACSRPNVTHPQGFYWHLSGKILVDQLQPASIPARGILHASTSPWHPWELHWNPIPRLLVNKFSSVTPKQTPPPSSRLQPHTLQWCLNFSLGVGGSSKSVPSFGILPSSRGGSCPLHVLFLFRG